MAAGDVQGLAESYALLDRVPEAARDQLAVEMAIIGREILAAQHADVAKDTGALDQALSLQLLLDRLKVRIGLLLGGRAARRFNGRLRKAVAGGPFYGRFVEFGRRAQTVLVTRHLKVVRRTGNNRNGNTRRTVFGGKPYKMKVTALAARPFIAQPPLADVADRHLAEFWAKTLARTGGAA